MGKERVIVIDGANVAYAERSAAGEPKVSNLILASRTLSERGYRTITIIDASLYHEIDDPQQLDGLLDNQDIRQAPSGTDADYFVLETADRYDALVLSNDEYQRYRDDYDWIDDRRLPFMIINGKLEIYEPKLQDDK